MMQYQETVSITILRNESYYMMLSQFTFERMQLSLIAVISYGVECNARVTLIYFYFSLAHDFFFFLFGNLN